MGYIFVKVRKNQKQFQHAIALMRIGFTRALFEVLDDGKSVRQKPFQVAGLHRRTFPAPVKRRIGSLERFVQKVVEAQLFSCQSGGNRIRARRFAAVAGGRPTHFTTPLLCSAPGSRFGGRGYHSS